MSASPARFKVVAVDNASEPLQRMRDGIAEWLETLPTEPEPTPLYDALREYPTANVWRRAYLRDRIAQLSGVL